MGSALAPSHLLFLDHRLLITWLTVDSAVDVESLSPLRLRSHLSPPNRLLRTTPVTVSLKGLLTIRGGVLGNQAESPSPGFVGKLL